MESAEAVLSILFSWKIEDKISIVLFTCQSVLHELPTRSSKFSEEDFLNAYLMSVIILPTRK